MQNQDALLKFDDFAYLLELTGKRNQVAQLMDLDGGSGFKGDHFHRFIGDRGTRLSGLNGSILTQK